MNINLELWLKGGIKNIPIKKSLSKDHYYIICLQIK